MSGERARGGRSAMPPILVVGLSPKSAPVEVREKLAAGADVLPEVPARLARQDELSEVMFLSTCNRVEVFASPRQPGHAGAEAGASAVREALREQLGAPSESDLATYLYEKSGEDAVRHIFRVTASLDSMVLGEPQIFGQVKDAYEAAQAAKTMGNLLGRCVTRAFTVAKRVRTETALGAGVVSISSVAVDLARRIFGDLNEHSVLLVGAGEMAEAAAKSLGKGARSIRVCNRSFERAAQLAAQFGGGAAPLDQLESELLLADVVVASTSSKSFVITPDLVRRVMKARKGRTLFFIDIAVPRNVDPQVHQIDNVYVFNVDDLEEQVRQNMRARQAEVAQAEEIVATEVGEFETWVRGLDVQPTLVALRARTRGILMAELERSLSGKLKHLADADRAALQQMVESATNKLLHAPTTRLKAATTGEGGGELVASMRHLFDLTTETAQASDSGTVRSAPTAPVAEPDKPVTH